MSGRIDSNSALRPSSLAVDTSLTSELPLPADGQGEAQGGSEALPPLIGKEPVQKTPLLDDLSSKSHSAAPASLTDTADADVSLSSSRVPLALSAAPRRPPLPINKEGLIATSPFSIHSSYLVKGKIGQGTWGTVHLAVERTSGLERALKKVPKRFTSELFRFRQEVALMKGLDHPNVARLYEVFEDYANIYMVIEYCRGGELFDRLLASKYFCEGTAAKLVQQMLSGVNYLHERKIAHRDLKPENYLFLSKADNSPMKLIDFGLAKRFTSRRKMRTKVGTLYYVSPEVLAGSYDEQCDVWSVGVILHLLLCGTPPFNGPTDAAIVTQVRKAEVKFSGAVWNRITPYARQLIAAMLHRDPACRPSAKEALRHPWFAMFSPPALVRLNLPRPLSSPGFSVLPDLSRSSSITTSCLPHSMSLPPNSAGATASTSPLSSHAFGTEPPSTPPSCCELLILGVHSPLCTGKSQTTTTAGPTNSPGALTDTFGSPPQLPKYGQDVWANNTTTASAAIGDFGIPRMSTTNNASAAGLSSGIKYNGSNCNINGSRSQSGSYGIGTSGISHKAQVMSHGSAEGSQQSGDVQKAGGDDCDIEVWRNLARQLVPRWKRFAAHNQLKRAALHVIAQQLNDEDDLTHLRSFFLALDAKRDGILCCDEMSLGMSILSDGGTRHEMLEGIATSRRVDEGTSLNGDSGGEVDKGERQKISSDTTGVSEGKIEIENDCADGLSVRRSGLPGAERQQSDCEMGVDDVDVNAGVSPNVKCKGSLQQSDIQAPQSPSNVMVYSESVASLMDELGWSATPPSQQQQDEELILVAAEAEGTESLGHLDFNEGLPVLSPNSQQSSMESLGAKQKQGFKYPPAIGEPTVGGSAIDGEVVDRRGPWMTQKADGEDPQPCGVPNRNPTKFVDPEILRELIQSVTLDGGHVLDYSNFLAATMTSDQYLNESTMKAAFRVFDRDGDGRINTAELRASLGWSDPHGPALTDRNAMYTIRHDGGGEISGLIDQKENVEEQLREIVALSDADGDGYIGYSDFVSMMMHDGDTKGDRLSSLRCSVGAEAASLNAF